MTRRLFFALIGMAGWRPSTLVGLEDLCLRLAYTVLYDHSFFVAQVKDYERGYPQQNGAWVAKQIAVEHDSWIRGELAPILKEYFRRAPWSRDSFPEYKGVLFD